MIRIFAGVVETGDSCRCNRYDKDGSVHVGGEDVVKEVQGQFAGKVTVAICDKSFSGDLDVDMGYGYSEVTPEESDKLFVGRTNVIQLLEAAAGKEVVMVVADEPVNMIEVMERVRKPRQIRGRHRMPSLIPKKNPKLSELGSKLRSSVTFHRP
jgi:hypothetical protein